MKTFLLFLVMAAGSYCMVAGGDLLCLSEFLEQIGRNRTFVYPVNMRPMTIPAYSVVSLEQKKDPARTKPVDEIPAYAADHFFQWINIIVKKQAINENLRTETIALPDVFLFENRMPDGRHVFSWISDILLVRNNTPPESWSWDTGSSFVFCLTGEENDLADEKQVREHITTTLSRYTNFFQEDRMPHYTFEAEQKNGIWQGKYELSQQESPFWTGFVEFIAGRDFTCLFFAELQGERSFLQRSRPGDDDRF